MLVLAVTGGFESPSDCHNVSIGTIVPKGVGHFHPAFCGTLLGPRTFLGTRK